jgi:hypothetical protein
MQGTFRKTYLQCVLDTEVMWGPLVAYLIFPALRIKMLIELPWNSNWEGERVF